MIYAKIVFSAFLGFRALYGLTGIVLLFKREWEKGFERVSLNIVYPTTLVGLLALGVITNFLTFATALIVLMSITFFLIEKLKKKYPKQTSHQPA